MTGKNFKIIPIFAEMQTRLSYCLRDLKHLTLCPKRYDTPANKSRSYWSKVSRAYGNMQKAILSSAYHWRVITYDDGRKELAYLRVLQGGLLSGMFPAIYRGLIIPRKIGYGTFSRIKSIEIAF